jgi:hypothetical protein
LGSEYEYEWRDPEPSASSTSTTDWSEWALDADRSQWGRSRVFLGKEEIEWQNPEASASSTSKPEETKDKGKGKKGQLSVAFYRHKMGESTSLGALP